MAFLPAEIASDMGEVEGVDCHVGGREATSDGLKWQGWWVVDGGAGSQVQ